MNKNVYMAVTFSVLLGLYIPKFMQLATTVFIFGSLMTFILFNFEKFFSSEDGTEKENDEK